MNVRSISKALALLACVVIALPGAPTRADDWPMYGRDSSRNAVSPEKNPPTDWQIETRDDAGKVTAAARNIKWKALLGNHSRGTPTISDGLVWICTTSIGLRDPSVTKDAGCLLCLNESDGKFRWQYLSPRLEHRINDWPGSGTGSPPLIEGDRLWFVTNRWEVVCFDIGPLLNATGEPKQLWKLDMQRELGVHGTTPMMGYYLRCAIGSSYHGLIYVITGNGIDYNPPHVVAPLAPSLVCIEKQTGKVVWSDNSPGKQIIETQCASPLVAEINGKTQVIAPQGDGWIRSFEPLTGKLLWKFDANSKNAVWPGTRGELMAPPALYENRLYVALGMSRQDERQGRIWCIDPSRFGDISEELDDGPLAAGADSDARGQARRGKPNPNSGVIWKFEKIPAAPGEKITHRNVVHRTMGTVAVANGLAIVADCGGFVHCLDAATGERYWVQDVEEPIDGSPLICDGKVYVATEEGTVFILALSKKLELIGKREFETMIFCSPIISNGVLYIVARDAAYAIQTAAPPAPAASATAPAVEIGAPITGQWPQWRGPDRTNIARDSGLLRAWPAEGPPVLWKAHGLGEGVPSVAVANNRVYTLGYRQDSEYLSGFDAASGNKVVEAHIGPAVKEQPGMRWLSQRTPTVDGDRIYAVTARGELICVSVDGNERWRKDYAQDYGGKPGVWGYCDYPLVDGDLLICTPGGKDAAVVALNKVSGQLVWKCAVPGCAHGGYSAVVMAEIAGVRQYVQQLECGAVGIDTTGKLLWRYDALHHFWGNVHTAIVRSDQVFVSGGWGVGCALLKLNRSGEQFAVAEQYHVKKASAFQSWVGNSSLIDQRVYTNAGACLDFNTGNIMWNRQAADHRTTMAVADGKLYFRLGDGTMILADVDPVNYVETGRFPPPRATKEPAWTSPVIAGGRLYLRDQDELLCYDLRENRSRPFGSATTQPLIVAPPATQPAATAARGRRPNDAIFVATPQDIVDKMLELAAVGKSDVVYDLGCGDGRIVVTAGKKYGCRAVGFDTDPECVRMSNENVAKANVEDRVTIVEKDIFTADLAGASVVTLYMGREVNRRLVPQLQKLAPGSRIVSHEFDIEGYQPDRVIDVVSAADDTKHAIYLWTAPLKKRAAMDAAPTTRPVNGPATQPPARIAGQST